MLIMGNYFSNYIDKVKATKKLARDRNVPVWHIPLANSIGIDWKGTQLPLKTDRADTLIFNLRAHPGGAVAI